MLIAGVYVWFALAVRGAHDFSGDEPHYLAMTQSLWLYHTLDQHRVLYHHDFLAYFPTGMSSHTVHRGTHLYPLHYPALPLVLLPGFAVAGAAGAQIVAVAIAAMVLWRTWALAARVAGEVAATLSVGVLGLSAPFVLNAGAIYPDLLSALLLLLIVDALGATALSKGRATAVGLLLALCPWVHVKLLFVSATGMSVAAWLLWRETHPAVTTPARRRPGSRRVGLRGVGLSREGRWQVRAALALGTPIVSILLLMAYCYVLYGSPSPAAPYQGATLFTGNPLGGAIGQTFAQAQGVLGVAPFALLAIPGAIALWRRDRALAARILVFTVPFWLATLTYRDWWGGDAPPLRYLLPYLPLWCAGIAVVVGSMRAAATRLLVAALAAWTLAVGLAAPDAVRLGWPLRGGESGLLTALGDRLRLPFTAWLPRFEPARDGPGLWLDAPLIAIWAAIIVSACVLVARLEARARASADVAMERGLAWQRGDTY